MANNGSIEIKKGDLVLIRFNGELVHKRISAIDEKNIYIDMKQDSNEVYAIERWFFDKILVEVNQPHWETPLHKALVKYEIKS